MEKTNEKERTVEERLKDLYQLQTIYSEIDRIRNLRGELPIEVKSLEDNVAGLQTRIEKTRTEIAELKKLMQKRIGERAKSVDIIARYQEQLDKVRNNREYENLSKELEFEGLNVELADKNIREYGAKIEELELKISNTQEELTDVEHILNDKREELTAITSETKEQEENLMVEALKLEENIDAYTLAAFKRIRSNARNGLGIVTVQRNACGGCFNRIPPQRQLEIKMHKKVIVCEYCGRIMIDAVLAGVEEEKPAEAPKRRSSRRSATTDK